MCTIFFKKSNHTTTQETRGDRDNWGNSRFILPFQTQAHSGGYLLSTRRNRFIISIMNALFSPLFLSFKKICLSTYTWIHTHKVRLRCKPTYFTYFIPKYFNTLESQNNFQSFKLQMNSDDHYQVVMNHSDLVTGLYIHFLMNAKILKCK